MKKIIIALLVLFAGMAFAWDTKYDTEINTAIYNGRCVFGYYTKSLAQAVTQRIFLHFKPTVKANLAFDVYSVNGVNFHLFSNVHLRTNGTILANRFNMSPAQSNRFGMNVYTSPLGVYNVVTNRTNFSIPLASGWNYPPKKAVLGANTSYFVDFDNGYYGATNTQTVKVYFYMWPYAGQ
jgi:hypothetical protein